MSPDVIHCHDNKLFPFFFTERKKTILTVHAMNLSCWFLKYYHQIFAISQAVKEDVKKRANVDAQLVFNGIAIDEYQQRMDFKSGQSFKIVQISRLDLKDKGQHIAIQAAVYLKGKYPDMNFTMTFIGDGEDKEKLKALAVENKIDDSVVFEGQKSRSWIKERLQNFDVLIQPSLHEGFGLTIIEGLAAGLPVIASNIEGPKEILDFLHVGSTVEVGSSNDLAEKIHQIYDNYVSGNLLNTNYLIKDKKQLGVFDIQKTVINYIKSYQTISNDNYSHKC
jgi:glycosyltransferase involved in cell wall biosynthesis